MKINLHIERLLLDGVPVEQRQGPLLQAAIAQELDRLLSASQLTVPTGAGGSLASIKGSSIQMTERADPAGLGAQIAAVLHDGLGGRL